MIVKLLTEHHLEFLTLKGGCRVYTCQNVKLLEISCRGSDTMLLFSDPLQPNTVFLISQFTAASNNILVHNYSRQFGLF